MERVEGNFVPDGEGLAHADPHHPMLLGYPFEQHIATDRARKLWAALCGVGAPAASISAERLRASIHGGAVGFLVADDCGEDGKRQVVLGRRAVADLHLVEED